MGLPTNFDLRAIHVFVLTAELGGMTQSAKTLNLTQSAVSQIIANLEETIGNRLFDRSIRPIALTASGHILLERGREIIQATKDVYREARTTEPHRLASVTIAMTDSMASVVGTSLYERLKDISSTWRIWSGLSPSHRDEFLSHAIDIMVTTSNVMDDVSGLQRYKILQEPYVMIYPKEYKGPCGLSDKKGTLPFLRYSKRSAMGLQIERQLNRMRLFFPELIELDRSYSHTAAVARGLGWGISTPLCLLESPSILDQIQIHPISRGAFSRHFDLLARKGSLTGVAKIIAHTTSELLETECLPKLYPYMPWLEDKLEFQSSENPVF